MHPRRLFGKIQDSLFFRCLLGKYVRLSAFPLFMFVWKTRKKIFAFQIFVSKSCKILSFSDICLKNPRPSFFICSYSTFSLQSFNK
jgi:hypothetical protein